MRIYIAGGIHDDPLGRKHLEEWLKRLVDKLGYPAFVAVEADPNIRWFLRARRRTFERLAGGLWSDGVEPAVAHVLAQTMGWEVDAHRAIVDVDPVFLDAPGTREATVEPKQHFLLMVLRLEGFAGDRGSAAEVAAHISERAVAGANVGGTHRYDSEPNFRQEQAAREEGWHRTLRPELRQDGWGLVVIGALHASRYDDRTFRSLLAVTPGVEVAAVNYLGWSPPAAIA
jgi:hypothetical protein